MFNLKASGLELDSTFQLKVDAAASEFLLRGHVDVNQSFFKAECSSRVLVWNQVSQHPPRKHLQEQMVWM